VRRDLEYGLAFYRNHRVLDYEKDGVPTEAHVLVVRESAAPNLKQLLAGRTYEPLFSYPAQHVAVYRVGAAGSAPENTAAAIR
jgi:hypothetical protein